MLPVDGIDVSLTTNVDDSLARVRIVGSVTEDARNTILADVEKHYGVAHPDTRVFSRPQKWGLVQTTDPCGRAVYLASPTTTP
ncbi:MAG: hypothetical protein ACYDA1_00760 [Vulcanimicrobiaceae bacterium]